MAAIRTGRLLRAPVFDASCRDLLIFSGLAESEWIFLICAGDSKLRLKRNINGEIITLVLKG
jgi:hypothetical protein